MTTYGFFNWPVWEALLVTEMTEIEYITKKFIFQLRILDDWHSTVLERQRGGGGGGGREGEGERKRERSRIMVKTSPVLFQTHFFLYKGGKSNVNY